MHGPEKKCLQFDAKVHKNQSLEPCPGIDIIFTHSWYVCSTAGS